MIDLEVAYNHWAPFRFAWVLMLLACLCVLLQMGSGWKVLYPLGLASYAGRHGGDAHRLLHARDDFRPRAGHQHV